MKDTVKSLYYNVTVCFTTHELANESTKCWCMTQCCKWEGSLVWSTSCVSHSDTAGWQLWNLTTKCLGGIGEYGLPLHLINAHNCVVILWMKAGAAEQTELTRLVNKKKNHDCSESTKIKPLTIVSNRFSDGLHISPERFSIVTQNSLTGILVFRAILIWRLIPLSSILYLRTNWNLPSVITHLCGYYDTWFNLEYTNITMIGWVNTTGFHVPITTFSSPHWQTIR